MHQLAKFRAAQSNFCGNMTDFQFFNMAAVRHLIFVLRDWTTHKVYLLVSSLCKI